VFMGGSSTRRPNRWLQFLRLENYRHGAKANPARRAPPKKEIMIVSWFSAGVSSAVATMMAKPDRIIYIDIEDQHPDSDRFIVDCERWFGKKIDRLMSPLKSVERCCYAASFIRGPHGAACTTRLKKRVRKEWEVNNPGRHIYVWGFDAHEKHRADDTVRAMPAFDHLFPILDRTKSEVHGMLDAAGINRPAMYNLGYQNNNCVGCVKGGMAYWNRIRKDFPDVFERRAIMERKIGAHILKECYLDELDPCRGRDTPIILPDCGIFCEIETVAPARPVPPLRSAVQNGEAAKTTANRPSPQ
jgi:hypothetical protein